LFSSKKILISLKSMPILNAFAFVC
jgi:hypothetical protein